MLSVPELAGERGCIAQFHDCPFNGFCFTATREDEIAHTLIEMGFQLIANGPAADGRQMHERLQQIQPPVNTLRRLVLCESGSLLVR